MKKKKKLKPTITDNIVESLKQEFQQLSAKSLLYTTEITNAKTEFKRAYFKKKLAKNNELVMKILMVLESFKPSKPKEENQPETQPEVTE